MTIAEFFVNIGVKGDGSANKALSGVKTGLGEVKSMSLEAKAAVLGAIYAFEKMMSASSQQGTSLLNFSSLTGMSAQALQQWQYAARQAGVDGDELTGSLKAVQSAMMDTLQTGNAPEGMVMVANKTKMKTDADSLRDTAYVMQNLQKFAQSVPADVGNRMLKSFGLSEGTIAAMRRNAFTPEMMAKAPTYSDREIGTLNKADVAWKNLGAQIQMAFGHFNAKHGLELVRDLTMITKSVERLANSLVTLAEKGQIFFAFGESIKGLSQLMDLMNGKSLAEVTKPDKGKRALGEGTWWMNAVEGAEDKYLDLKSNKFAPPPVQKPDLPFQHHVEVTQNLNFQHEGKDAKKTAGSVHQAVKHAYRQYSAQGQGS